jgi:hypothetical protein
MNTDLYLCESVKISVPLSHSRLVGLGFLEYNVGRRK